MNKELDNSTLVIKFFYEDLRREYWREMKKDDLYDIIFDMYGYLKKYYRLTGEEKCKELYKKLFDLFISLNHFEEHSCLLNQ